MAYRFARVSVSNVAWARGLALNAADRSSGRLDAGLSGVGAVPSTVRFRSTHLVLAGSVHSVGGDSPLCDDGVPTRPRAAGSSRREASSERRVVATPQLAVDPAEADRLLGRLVVRGRRRIARPLLGQNEPDPRRVGVMGPQPSSPLTSASERQLWELHGAHRIPDGPIRARSPSKGQSEGVDRLSLRVATKTTPPRRGNRGAGVVGVVRCSGPRRDEGASGRDVVQVVAK